MGMYPYYVTCLGGGLQLVKERRGSLGMYYGWARRMSTIPYKISQKVTYNRIGDSIIRS